MPQAHYNILSAVGLINVEFLDPYEIIKIFLAVLEKEKNRFGFYLYSYNLLPNHVHFSIEVGDISVSEIMHYLNGYYAGYSNRRHKRSGHLFQDRFYSALIDTESYFWAGLAHILTLTRCGRDWRIVQRIIVGALISFIFKKITQRGS